MPENKIILRLSEEEYKLKSCWEDLISRLKTSEGKIDLGLIWTDEVKENFERIKEEARKIERIEFILKKIYAHYRKDEDKYSKEIYDIKLLLKNLHKIEAKPEWLRQVHGELQQVISDIEEEKSEIRSINKKSSRRKFLRSGGKAAVVALAALNVPFLLSTANAAESKKYLSFEELMKLIERYGYLYYNSNIKSGEVPRIILFGEEHDKVGIDYDKDMFLREFFGLVDKEGKELVCLFEHYGGKESFSKHFTDFPVSDKAIYIGVDTYRDSQKDLKFFSDFFNFIKKGMKK